MSKTELIHAIARDDRYKSMSVHDLKVVRANMVKLGYAHNEHTKYEFALVQFWIMHKEGRLTNYIKGLHD